MEAAPLIQAGATPTRAEREKWRQIQGSIADAIRERLEAITAAVEELNAHLAGCEACQAKDQPFKLCGAGNRLFNAVLEA